MDDLIFRQAAITAIQKAYCDTDGGEDKYAVWKNMGLTEALHIMQDLPAAQRWISVEERLPENKREKYLILTDGGYECDARWTDNVYGLGQSDRWGWSIFDIPQYSKVTHWMPRMPLPEPPKEEP